MGAAGEFISKQECWNWQTGQTKDLVAAMSCGFKSHLLQDYYGAETFEISKVSTFFLSKKGLCFGHFIIRQRI